MADLAALKSAARAAIVIPAVFALADKVIAQPQTSILAAFGSFSVLVLVDFTGTARTRFLAYADAARGRDKPTVHAALQLLWASQHIDNLWRLEEHLGERRAAT